MLEVPLDSNRGVAEVPPVLREQQEEPWAVLAYEELLAVLRYEQPGG